MKERELCIDCGKEVRCTIESEKVEIEVRGTRFQYIEFAAYCTECGAEIYIPEINEMNKNNAEEAYRKAAHLISIDEIRDIIDKYSIGAGPLAVLLGFGEVTINRYMAGQLPSRCHSEKLLKIKYDRKEMETLLERGKNSISQVAYARCKKRIDDLNELYGCEKIEVVARYLIAKAEDITGLALQKLLYYAQAFHRAIYGEILFADDCQAWMHGPAFPNVYHKYKDFGRDPICNPVDECDDDFGILTTKEITLLDSIIAYFGCYSGKTLREMTHNEKPWIDARGDLQPCDRSIATIKRENIDAYFADVVKQHGIINPCDIVRYSEDMYKKVNME